MLGKVSLCLMIRVSRNLGKRTDRHCDKIPRIGVLEVVMQVVKSVEKVSELN
jgi:hypothetical protein